ncbi:hypothetical protein RRG08_064995 [Elysia crispata]|uniref:Uncharacterized protein n=1 Tax=Elysia crispata TaxID=231223 RepID=A0AAE0ZK51_9GAST|nr:hypothetical protein RRG08_064995 [Elysia crispata]
MVNDRFEWSWGADAARGLADGGYPMMAAGYSVCLKPGLLLLFLRDQQTKPIGWIINLIITRAFKIVVLIEIPDQILRNGMINFALNVANLFVKFFQIALATPLEKASLELVVLVVMMAIKERDARLHVR